MDTTNMTQKDFLQAILEKTDHVRGGLAVQDLDVVTNAIDEREGLIAALMEKKFATFPEDCVQLAERISAMDDANRVQMQIIMDECNEKVFEARRKIKELQTGKKANHQYVGAAAVARGGAFDFKR